MLSASGPLCAAISEQGAGLPAWARLAGTGALLPDAPHRASGAGAWSFSASAGWLAHSTEMHEPLPPRSRGWS